MRQGRAGPAGRKPCRRATRDAGSSPSARPVPLWPFPKQLNHASHLVLQPDSYVSGGLQSSFNRLLMTSAERTAKSLPSARGEILSFGSARDRLRFGY